MTKTLTITLDGVSYEVPAFNLRQLRQIAKMGGTLDKVDVPFEILKLALATATPPVAPDDVDEIQAGPGEFQVAVRALLVAAGLATEDRDAPEGEARPPAQGA